MKPSMRKCCPLCILGKRLFYSLKQLRLKEEWIGAEKEERGPFAPKQFYIECSI